MAAAGAYSKRFWSRPIHFFCAFHERFVKRSPHLKESNFLVCLRSYNFFYLHFNRTKDQGWGNRKGSVWFSISEPSHFASKVVAECKPFDVVEHEWREGIFFSFTLFFLELFLKLKMKNNFTKIFISYLCYAKFDFYENFSS